MNKTLITLIAALAISQNSFAADMTATNAPAGPQGSARYSEHLPLEVGLLADVFPQLDEALVDSFQRILSNATPRTIRILEVGPGDGHSSATFRLLSAAMKKKLLVPSGLCFEIWHIEPSDGHRVNLKKHWEALNAVLVAKKFPKTEYKLSKAKGQEFFKGQAFKDLVARSGESPFELVVSSNVLHFMSSEDQLLFSKAVARSLAPNGELVIATRGIHESEEYLESASAGIAEQIRFFQKEFLRRFADGHTIFAGFIEEYYDFTLGKVGVGTIFHSAQTLGNLLAASGIKLTILSAEDLLAPFLIKRPTDTIDKKASLVLIVARKNL